MESVDIQLSQDYTKFIFSTTNEYLQELTDFLFLPENIKHSFLPNLLHNVYDVLCNITDRIIPKYFNTTEIASLDPNIIYLIDKFNHNCRLSPANGFSLEVHNKYEAILGEIFNIYIDLAIYVYEKHGVYISLSKILSVFNSEPYLISSELLFLNILSLKLKTIESPINKKSHYIDYFHRYQVFFDYLLRLPSLNLQSVTSATKTISQFGSIYNLFYNIIDCYTNTNKLIHKKSSFIRPIQVIVDEYQNLVQDDNKFVLNKTESSVDPHFTILSSNSISIFQSIFTDYDATIMFKKLVSNTLQKLRDTYYAQVLDFFLEMFKDEDSKDKVFVLPISYTYQDYHINMAIFASKYGVLYISVVHDVHNTNFTYFFDPFDEEVRASKDLLAFLNYYYSNRYNSFLNDEFSNKNQTLSSYLMLKDNIDLIYQFMKQSVKLPKSKTFVPKNSAQSFENNLEKALFREVPSMLLLNYITQED